MIKTIVWFTSGGLFTALYSNALRRLPLFRKPMLHITCTGVGFVIGVMAHRFENNVIERLEHKIEKDKGTVWYPRSFLLAERAKALGITLTNAEATAAEEETEDSLAEEEEQADAEAEEDQVEEEEDDD